MAFNSESHHWYDKETGESRYETENKSKPGTFRKTTLRDARANNWVPSVTTIMKVLDKPGLNRWKENQILEAALTLPSIDGESLHDFAKRVKEDAAQHGKDAMNEGTRIHGILEAHFMGNSWQGKPTDLHIVESVEKMLKDQFGDQTWKPEKSFSTDDFGGKVDLHSNHVVIDFKTSEFDENKKMPGYDEQVVQLSAYREGLGLNDARCANVFISVSKPGLVVVKEWKPEEMARGLEMFKSALSYWKWQKRFF